MRASREPDASRPLQAGRTGRCKPTDASGNGSAEKFPKY
jgi:hypothetical protein